MTNFDAGGILPGQYDFSVRTRGRCPLDGYQLIETDPVTVQIDGKPVEVDGGWEHVIPAAEIPTMTEALRKIADTHGFEASAEAEQILEAP
ncbi:hypothetical protein ACGFNU_21400 [Spirillospora sp. NPDC048911]|uniref:hypothetical protein n=1 Tax=Spirillospora sp. NPDC048911 TaxID=3364527 RepID=UPI003721B100